MNILVKGALGAVLLGGIAVNVAAQDKLERSQPAPSDPIPLGRETPPHAAGADVRIGNNAAPDIAPGVDTGSKVPIPHDRNGMVDSQPANDKDKDTGDAD